MWNSQDSTRVIWRPLLEVATIIMTSCILDLEPLCVIFLFIAPNNAQKENTGENSFIMNWIY